MDDDIDFIIKRPTGASSTKLCNTGTPSQQPTVTTGVPADTSRPSTSADHTFGEPLTQRSQTPDASAESAPKKRKRSNKDTARQDSAARIRLEVKEFWAAHYAPSKDSQLSVSDVLNFFDSSSNTTGATPHQFKSTSGELGFKVRKQPKNEIKFAYAVVPSSTQSKSFHQLPSRSSKHPSEPAETNDGTDKSTESAVSALEPVQEPAHNGALGSKKKRAPSADKEYAAQMRNSLLAFWHAHYDLKHASREIPAHEVFSFFQTTPYSTGQSLNQFVFESTRSVESLVSARRQPSVGRVYILAPKSRLAHQFHLEFHEDSLSSPLTPGPRNSVPSLGASIASPHSVPLAGSRTDNLPEALKRIDVHQVNMRGLITDKINKCPFLNEIVSSKGSGSKIIAVTETWPIATTMLRSKPPSRGTMSSESTEISLKSQMIRIESAVKVECSF